MRSIEGVSKDGHAGGGGGGLGPGYMPFRSGRLSPRPIEEARPPLDHFERTPPTDAVLALLRQRILENTRLALGLERAGPDAGARFVAPTDDSVESYVGRLLSEQNMAGARRAAEWSPTRVRAALELGTEQGLAETLQILHEVERLDARAWDLVCAVLHEFHRKIDVVLQDREAGRSDGDAADESAAV